MTRSSTPQNWHLQRLPSGRVAALDTPQTGSAPNTKVNTLAVAEARQMWLLRRSA